MVFQSAQEPKTTYTPIFYSTSTSSSSDSCAKSLQIYLDRLSRRHVALAQIVEEVPPSRCTSPGAESRQDLVAEREVRIEAIRKRVREALIGAHGDPADGRWGFVAEALKTACTRGRYRWSGVSEVKKKPWKDGDWILASTEEEWFEWERRRTVEERLNTKVENWKKTVVNDAPVSIDAGFASLPDQGSGSLQADVEEVVASTSRTHPAKQATAKNKQLKLTASGHSLLDPSPLGFTVAKRSTVRTAEQPKVPPSASAHVAPSGLSSKQPARSRVRERVPSNSKPKIQAGLAPEIQGSGSASKSPAEGISDVSESMFLPPSFPSQLQTSTPIVTRAKVPPIPHVDLMDHSPTHGKPHSKELGPTSSLPVLSTTSEEHRQGKRLLNSSPKSPLGLNLKKARTMPTLEYNSELQPPEMAMFPLTATRAAADMDRSPTTPHRLPTLTDLIASSKNKKSPSSRAQTLLKSHSVQTKLPLPELAQMVAEDKWDKGEEDIAKLLPNPTTVTSYEELYGAPMEQDNPSPTKSLTSLAGSDSEQSDAEVLDMHIPGFTQNEDAFQPVCASTQVDGVGCTTGVQQEPSAFSFGMYNSQFDVEGEVDRVSELLERDVDFRGWLKDVSDGDDGEFV